MPIIQASRSSHLLIKNQTPNLNTLPSRRLLRRIRVEESRMRRPDRDPLPPTRLTLSSGVIALEQHNIVRRHILHVIEPVAIVRRHGKSLAFNFVPFGAVVAAVDLDVFFFAAVVVVVDAVGALGVEEVHGNEVAGLGGAPVYYC